jgi:threonyl-tRNA synthetase
MSKYDLDTLRHSASHVMAQAVKDIYENVKLGIGPAIKNGFYYDFDLNETIKEEDLPAIEERMRQIIENDYKFEKQVISKDEALRLFKELNEPYKIELINELEDGEISIYKDGDFIDLCKGPHVASTGQIKHFKLLSVAGAYWRGDEKKPQLSRIYATAFDSKDDLDNYLNQLKEAKERDHRKGFSLGYFSMHQEVGPGLIVYHPKGAMLRSIIVDYMKQEHLKRGYQMVLGPHVMKSDIWKISGHADFYKDNMYFFEIDGQEYAVKPMNCPSHILVYASAIRSYNSLPLRFFELGTVYRHEKTGVLHGLLRVRGFTQDDAHIFCMRAQLKEEILGVIKFVKETMTNFGFNEYEYEVSTRPEKYIGSEEDWNNAEKILIQSLEDEGEKFDINEKDGAFYGPKIDIKIKDALGRPWQCATIQCDFALPERFDLCYIDNEGNEQRPVMLHRVILGSIERFIGVLLEHYNFALPLWLAPEQVRILPITSRVNDYANEINSKLIDSYRSTVDVNNDTLGNKIRKAQQEKVPYMVIVGDKEEKSKKLSIRSLSDGDLGLMDTEGFINKLTEDTKNRR